MSTLSMPDIQGLSDKDLRSELSNYNIKAGPLGKMRKVYEKRLFKSIHGHDFGKKPEASSMGTPKVSKIIKNSVPPSTAPNPVRPDKLIQKTKSTATPAAKPSETKSTNNHRVQRSVINYESLTNNQIRDRIKDHGDKCGPISTASIRKLMIKKLARLDEEAFNKDMNKGIIRAAAVDDLSKIHEDNKNYSTAEDSSGDNDLSAVRSPSHPMGRKSRETGKIQKPAASTQQLPISNETRNTTWTLSPVKTNSANFSSEDDETDDSMGQSKNSKHISPMPSGEIITRRQVSEFTPYDNNQSVRSGHEISMQTSQLIGISNNADFSTEDEDYEEEKSADRLRKSSGNSSTKENQIPADIPSFTCEALPEKEQNYIDKKRQLARLSAGVTNKSLNQILRPRKSLVSFSNTPDRSRLNNDTRDDSDIMCIEESTKDISYVSKPTMNQHSETRKTLVEHLNDKVDDDQVSELSEKKQQLHDDTTKKTFSNFINFLPKIISAAILLLILSSILAIKKSNIGPNQLGENGVFDLECRNEDGLCLSRQELDDETKNILYKFHTELNEISALSACGETSQDPNIKIIDLLELVGVEKKISADHMAVKNTIKEFFIHPKYGVSIYDNYGKIIEDDESDTVLGTASSLWVKQPMIDHPKCKYHKMREEIYHFFWSRVLSGKNRIYFSIFVFIFITFKIIQMKIRNLNKHKEAVKNYADLIIDTVENLAATTNREKPINHIRDSLIDINSRAQQAEIWEEAVEFVRSNESRVTFKEEEIDGNFMEIVYWGDSTNIEKNLAFSDKWRGTACNKEILNKSPQGCLSLKIRDFFEKINEINTRPKKEQLLNEIMGQANLILQTKNQPKIWPIHYGFEENAAYLRFSDENEAINFYNSINAQWYNKKLLTPKFVQDSKYFKRFPEAKKSIYRK